MCSNAEHQAIDSIIDKGPVRAGMMDLKVVQGSWHLSFWANFQFLISSIHVVMLFLGVVFEWCLAIFEDTDHFIATVYLSKENIDFFY